MGLDIEITREDKVTLDNDRGWKKGQVVEKIVRSAMAQLNMPFIPYTELPDQIKQGDYVVQGYGGELKDTEVKSISGYNGIDKLYMDIFYYNLQGNGVKAYKQLKSTGHEFGWLYTCNADWLIGYNYRSGNMYIIKNFQHLKEQVRRNVILSCYGDKVRAIEGLEQRITRKLNPWMNWYINKNDKSKQTLTVTLDLTMQAFVAFGIDCQIIKINLIVS